MQNTYQRPPFHRRHWFLGLLIVLAVVACVGAIVAYTLHLQFLDKAGSFDMNELGRMESASTIFDRQHTTFGYIYEQKREPVPIAQMPMVLQHAVVSAEDNRFYTHSGSDFRGMIRAAFKNLFASRIKQGASTITQQLARNTFTLKGRTFGRKILEIYVAHRIETTLTKDQILEYYLNRIYLGSGLYGVEAASKGYFGKPTRDLSLGEAATLAGLIKSPNNLSPWQNKHAAQAHRDFVLGRMVDESYISRDEYQTAAADELAVKPRVLASSDSYAMEAVRQQVIQQVGLDRAISEGLRIYTTIDARLQKVAETTLHDQLDEIERNPSFQNHQTYAQYLTLFSDAEKRAATPVQDNATAPTNVHSLVGAPEYLQGALIAMSNSDGAVLALVGGRDFKHSEFNRAIHPQARRAAGTAFTPFVYAAAFQRGIFPGRLFLDQVMDNRQVMVGGQTGILGEWGVERAGNHYDGPIPAGMALIEGKNAATVRVGNEVGLDKVLELAKRAGITSPMRDFPATFLGSSEITLSELALAYTGFPNGGWRPAAPYLLTKIEDADGQVLFQAKVRPRVRIIDADPAFQVHAALSQDLKIGVASSASNRLKFRSEKAGGKPGTSYNFADALFAGYDSDVTCAVWTGFDKPTPIYRGAFGSQLAMPVWINVMNAAAEYLPSKDITPPRTLKKVEICTRSGALATDRCFEMIDGERRRTTFTTYATAAEMPTQTCPVHGGGRTPAAIAAILKNAAPVASASSANGLTVAKAVSAVNLDKVRPVPIKSPTVIGAEADPYGAVQPVTGPDAGLLANGTNAAGKAPDAGGQPTPPPVEKKVLPALPVLPAESEAAALPPVKVDPPDPLQFN